MKILWHEGKPIVGWKGDFSFSWGAGTKKTILRDVMRVRTLCELALLHWVWPAARNTIWPQEWAWTWGLWDQVCTREVDSYSLCCNFPHYHWIFSKALKDTDWSWLYRVWSDTLRMVKAVAGISPGWLSLAEWQYYDKAPVATSMRRPAFFGKGHGKLIDIFRILLRL